MLKRAMSYLPVLGLLITLHGHAATYYVRNGGDDSADGKSHATAWASIGKVNSFSFAAGDTVLFHEGHVWKQRTLTVDWAGTSSAKAVVGAYYVDNGKPVRGFKTARPVFDGEDAFPTRYDSLIVVNTPRVRVENLALINSEGRGISIYKGHFFEGVNLYINDTYDCGIALIESDDGLLENNHILETSAEKPEDGLTWCAAISVTRSDRAVVRRNTVERSYGEGLNANYGSDGTLFEDNKVFGLRAVGIYSDSSPNTTIRRNVVLGTTDKKYWRYSSTTGPGIAFNNEKYSHVAGGGRLDASVQSINGRVYNNVVAYTGSGIAFWGELGTDSFSNTLIYSNTLIDNGTQFLTIGYPMPSSVFANNILVSLTDGTRDVSGSATGLTTRNNYYSKGDPGGIYSHKANKYSGLQLSKMSGWRTIDSVSDVTAADFAPAKISTTNGAGDSSHLATATSKDAYHLDLNSKEHNSPIDLGGVRAGDPAAKRPKGPRLVGAQAQ
jgi:hypothetical protein